MTIEVWIRQISQVETRSWIGRSDRDNRALVATRRSLFNSEGEQSVARGRYRVGGKCWQPSRGSIATWDSRQLKKSRRRGSWMGTKSLPRRPTCIPFSRASFRSRRSPAISSGVVQCAKLEYIHPSTNTNRAILNPLTKNRLV